MSFGLGIILSDNLNDEFLNRMRVKYKLALIRINNPFVNNQLMPDELLYKVSEFDDTLSGIGAYHYYVKDSKFVQEKLEKSGCNQHSMKFMIDELIEQQRGYKQDTLKWVDIITTLKNEHKVDKVGLFGHMFYTSFDAEKILFRRKIECKLSEPNCEYLMKIKEDELVFFNNKN